MHLPYINIYIYNYIYILYVCVFLTIYHTICSYVYVIIFYETKHVHHPKWLHFLGDNFNVQHPACILYPDHLVEDIFQAMLLRFWNQKNEPEIGRSQIQHKGQIFQLSEIEFSSLFMIRVKSKQDLLRTRDSWMKYKGSFQDVPQMVMYLWSSLSKPNKTSWAKRKVNIATSMWKNP